MLLVAAGGGLSLALLQRLRQEKLGLPGAVGLLAPWCDLRKSGDTLTTLTGIDPVLQVGGWSLLQSNHLGKRDAGAGGSAYVGAKIRRAAQLSL